MSDRAPTGWIDVSPIVSVETPVWPGDQPLSIRWLARLAAGDTTNLSAITMSPHLGAHVDAPRHFLDAGLDLIGLGLQPFLGPALLLDVSRFRGRDGAIPRSALDPIDSGCGERRLLLRTRAPGGEAAPLSAEAAAALAGSGLLLLGIDGASVDPKSATTLANHVRLAAARVAVLVGLELGPAPAGRVELVALPLAIDGLEASPVRAVVRPLG
jgi:arylformamidase